MADVEEAIDAKTQLAGDLAAGVDTISLNQSLTFYRYVRLVLPLDGFVFWVKAGLIGPNAAPNVAAPGVAYPNEGPAQDKPEFVTATGSLHWETVARQEADANYSVNTMTFTSLGPINDLDELEPGELFIAEHEGQRFAFSRRRGFYRQAGLWHYVGDAVYPIMASQLIESASDFVGRQIVSNSIPLWLSLNYVAPAPWFPFPLPVRVYPAFLTPENEPFPFAAVDVSTTTPLASAPTFGRKRWSRDQQVRDRVRVTLWGLDNDAASDFVDFVTLWSDYYSGYQGGFGLANSPVVRDEHMTQVELGTIAQKKVVEYEVNYHQRSARDVARQLILRCVPTYELFDNPVEN